MQKCSIDILHKIFVSGFFAAMKQTGGYLVYDFPFIWQKSHIHEISKKRTPVPLCLSSLFLFVRLKE